MAPGEYTKPACPCIFLSPPTEGDCTAVVGWHIDTGNLGAVDLAGLNVARDPILGFPSGGLYTKPSCDRPR
ncbi:MAG: DUF1326 domain-containing protein [Acidobacteria bacterium]|nr:DUF1326 domain-containing protein [Acidobacteriota bacterium]